MRGLLRGSDSWLAECIFFSPLGSAGLYFLEAFASTHLDGYLLGARHLVDVALARCKEVLLPWSPSLLLWHQVRHPL